MADTAGSSLIASSITAGCMKWAVKPSVQLPFLSDELYVFSLREAEALIEKRVAEEDFERIAKKTHVGNIGLELGDRISGKQVLLVSGSAVEKISVGTSKFSSGRHKR